MFRRKDGKYLIYTHASLMVYGDKKLSPFGVLLCLIGAFLLFIGLPVGIFLFGGIEGFIIFLFAGCFFIFLGLQTAK